VFVHGMLSWSYLWRNVVRILAKDFAVYAHDMLGHGESENAVFILEKSLLYLLVANANHLLTRNQILDSLWGEEAQA
jgi:pimeloyl-ACP methyl ester carboxylesterase